MDSQARAQITELYQWASVRCLVAENGKLWQPYPAYADALLPMG